MFPLLKNRACVYVNTLHPLGVGEAGYQIFTGLEHVLNRINVLDPLRMRSSVTHSSKRAQMLQPPSKYVYFELKPSG